MKNVMAILIAFLIALAGANLWTSSASAHEPGMVLYGVGTATIDGIMSPGEWDGTRHLEFTVNTMDGGRQKRLDTTGIAVSNLILSEYIE